MYDTQSEAELLTSRSYYVFLISHLWPIRYSLFVSDNEQNCSEHVGLMK